VATMSCATEEQFAVGPSAQARPLRPIVARQFFGVQIKVVGEDGTTLPRDGKSQGELMVRGAVDRQRLLQERPSSFNRRVVSLRRYRDHRFAGVSCRYETAPKT